MTGNSYSGLNVFITVGGKLFTPDDLEAFEIHIIDSDEGDNEVEIHCHDNDYKIADSSLFRVGNILSIKWGYTTTGEFSQERTGYVIMKPATNYTKDGTISVIKALTKSASLAARKPQKSYGKTSVKTIVKDIADRSAMTLYIEGGNENLDGFSQGSWSDRQVLRTLADRFGYQVSYSSETITFTKRKFSDSPRLLLTFGKGEDSNVLTAHLNVDAHKQGADVAALVRTFDPKSKTASTGDNTNNEQELAIYAGTGTSWLAKKNPESKPTIAPPGMSVTSVVSKLAAWTPNARDSVQSPTGGLTDASPSDVRALLSSPDTVAGNSAAHAASLNLRKQKKHGELTIDTVGIPEAHARMIVEVQGLSKRDSGLWYVIKVHHKIAVKHGYDSTFELNRHGTNAGGGPKVKATVNQQKAGGDTGQQEKAVSVSADSGKKWVK